MMNPTTQCGFIWADFNTRAIAIPIGETILVNALLKEVPRRTNAISAQDVITAGAKNLRTLTNDAAVLCAIQAAYAKAAASTVYLAVAAACVSLPFAMFMEWKSVKPKAVPEEELKDDLATREKNE